MCRRQGATSIENAACSGSSSSHRWKGVEARPRASGGTNSDQFAHSNEGVGSEPITGRSSRRTRRVFCRLLATPSELADTRRCVRLDAPATSRRIVGLAKGTTKFFNVDRGYGFIAPVGGGNDVFVHITALERAGLGPLREGQQVEFEAEVDKRSGKTAVQHNQAGVGERERRPSQRSRLRPVCPVERLAANIADGQTDRRYPVAPTRTLSKDHRFPTVSTSSRFSFR